MATLAAIRLQHHHRHVFNQIVSLKFQVNYPFK